MWSQTPKNIIIKIISGEVTECHKGADNCENKMVCHVCYMCMAEDAMRNYIKVRSMSNMYLNGCE